MPRFEVRLTKPADATPFTITASVAARDAAEAASAARRCQPGYAVAEVREIFSEVPPRPHGLEIRKPR